MKHFIISIICCLSCVFPLTAGIQSSVTVDGNAYLEGESDHSAIKVFFEAITPSAQADSCLTNSDGSYGIGLATGIYAVYYSKNGYKPYTLPDEYFLEIDQTLPDVTLAPGGMQEVSGTVEGLWDDYYDYYVVGDIEVQAGDTLMIEGGVRVKFKGDYQFKVSGVLIAQGAEGDSIYFTSGVVPRGRGDWKNISFCTDTTDGSLLQYCVIEYGGNANNCEIYFDYTQSASIQILNSAIRYSSFQGIYCSGSDVEIEGSAIYENNSNGIYCEGSDAKIIGNKIYDNNSGLYCLYVNNAIIQENEVYGNGSDGIYCLYSDVVIIRNIVYDNYTGIEVRYGSKYPAIIHNQIFNNYNGIYIDNTHPTISQNTIYSNTYDGVGIGNNCTHAKIKNNIITANNCGISAGSEPEIISYNDIFGNNEGDLSGDGLPDSIGRKVTVNTNGDSTDTYFNLFEDAEMTDPANYDFSLLSTSPCIDASDPTTAKDPDSTIADIGALYYNQGADAPTADFSANNTSGNAPLGVEFTPVTTGPVKAYLWDFGDGYTSKRSYPVHTYTSASTYTVSLKVTGPGGSATEIKDDYIIIDAPPRANFTADKTTVYPSEDIQFINQSNGEITSYSWDFGDEGTSAEKNPIHSFDSPGKYMISLTVSGPDGSDTETKTDYITVLESSQVIAVFLPTETHCIAPYSVQFVNESIGSINSYLWNFGDDSTSTEESPLHTYQNLGDYIVQLIVYGEINNDTTYGTVRVATAAPKIESITDVEEDQGGKVLVKWKRSGYDNPVNAIVTSYTVWEDIKSEWTALGTVNARQKEYYTYLAATVKDSCPDITNFTYFRITAHTGDPQVFYDSPIDSGYSVDNLAPEAPQNLIAALNPDAVYLEWDESEAEDFDYFIVYRDEAIVEHTVKPNYTDTDVVVGEDYIYKVQAVDVHGNQSDFSDPLGVSYELSGIHEYSGNPKDYTLMQNFPNPFNPTTTIRYDIPEATNVTLTIYNMNGQVVDRLINQKQEPGFYSVNWNARNVSTGVYIYRIQVDGFSSVKKCIVIK